MYSRGVDFVEARRSHCLQEITAPPLDTGRHLKIAWVARFWQRPKITRHPMALSRGSRAIYRKKEGKRREERRESLRKWAGAVCGVSEQRGVNRWEIRSISVSAATSVHTHVASIARLINMNHGTSYKKTGAFS